MIYPNEVTEVQHRISLDASIKRSWKYALIITSILFFFSFCYIFGSMSDGVGGNIFFIVIPFWSLIFLLLVWPFIWAVTEFWRVVRYRSMMVYWPIRLIFAIVLFFGPIFIGLGYVLTFF